jgi:SHS2 domain-containing protein
MPRIKRIMADKKFEFLEHTADMYIVGRGKTLEEAFANTAVGLGFMIISSDNVKPKIKEEIKIVSEDKESLLFDFLSKFLYYQDAESLIFHKVKVECIKKLNSNWHLVAKAWGEKFDPEKHEEGSHVKAITYHYMEIKEEKNKCMVKVLVDI